MKICKLKTVDVAVDVTIGTDDIKQAITDSVFALGERPTANTILELVTACWQTLQALTDKQIALIGPANREIVAGALRTLADRIERKA